MSEPADDPGPPEQPAPVEAAALTPAQVSGQVFVRFNFIALLLGLIALALSHFLFAAADVVLVPSIFEPCGLTQMIGMRYGAVPVVRQTGGLADTVKDVDGESERGNGFTFEGTHEDALRGSLGRALSYFKTKQTWWEDLVRSNMKTDFSWRKSAQAYLDLYRSVT